MTTEAEDKDKWGTPKNSPDIPTDELEAWQRATSRLAGIARRDDLSRKEVSRRSGVPIGTLTPWYEGNYNGSYSAQTRRMLQWMDVADEQRAAAEIQPDGPGYFETRTAGEIVDCLKYAQFMPEMVVVTTATGMGKTESCRQYAAERPHVYLVTICPDITSVYMMLKEIAQEIGIDERDPGKVRRAIGAKLRRNGRKTLLIIDEAQRLSMDMADQLRYFLDQFGCGIALIGNDEVYDRFSGEPKKGQAQIYRRIGKRLKRLTPYPEDIEAQLDAWGISEPSLRQYLTIIGNKPGSLGLVEKTIKLAMMLAAGAKVPLTLEHLKTSWRNRSMETTR